MISKFLKQHPILRGMLTYSVLYPSSNATQQAFDPQKSKVDLKECGRFWIMGTFVVAPSLYGWVKVSSIIVKGNKFKNCLLRAYVEQLVWAPFAYTQFFLVINLLEGKSFRESLEQLKEKFWPTYKVGFCVWPLLQTLNFWIVPEKNRVPFIAVYSFAWNIFLSYVHHRSWKQNTTQVSGMAVYSLLSPSANAFQQIMDPQRKNFEPKQCVRFGLVEVFLIAPSLYGWIKIASVIVRGNTFKHSMMKAYLEQFLWTPFGYLQFFLGINLLEGKSFTESLEQLKEKFWTAYKVGFCIWPLIQSINFWLISEKNRVPFASMCAFLWQVFLSYVHNRRWNIEEIEDTKPS